MLNGVHNREIEQVRSAVTASDQLLVNLINKLMSVTDKLETLDERVRRLEISLAPRS